MQSDATVGWGEDCEALLKQCQAASEDERYVRAREAFDLLERIALGEDIVFFADEGSAWRVASLAATAGAEEYVSQVRTLLRGHASGRNGCCVPPVRPRTRTSGANSGQPPHPSL
jgi:hypothetical protein